MKDSLSSRAKTAAEDEPDRGGLLRLHREILPHGKRQRNDPAGDEEGTILLDFTIRDVSHTIKVKLTRNQGKKIFFNDNPVRKKDLMGLFRTVIFTPDELQLIKGAPVFRRRFLDMEISQVSPRYYAELLRYTRAVQQRNAAFRNARMTGIIPDTDIWDEQIGKCAAYIVRKRLETLKR